MNRLEGQAWIRIARELDAENRWLRVALTDLLFWIAERRELAIFAADLIEERFGKEST